MRERDRERERTEGKREAGSKAERGSVSSDERAHSPRKCASGLFLPMPPQVIERTTALRRRKRLWDTVHGQSAGERDQGKRSTSIPQL